MGLDVGNGDSLLSVRREGGVAVVNVGWPVIWAIVALIVAGLVC